MIAAFVLAAFVRAVEPTPTPEDAQRDAAEEFERGSQAYAAHDYAGALAAFERAQALSPHDRVRANIAMCLAELGRAREALAQLDAALAGSELAEPERAIVRVEITRIRKQLATLRTKGDVGLAVVVDGVDRCTTPCVLELDPGAHALVVEDPPLRERFELRAGQVLELPLARPVPAPRPVATPPVDHAPSKARARPSAMLWVGLPLVALGTAGTIGFGLRTRQHHDAYTAVPNVDTRDRGLRTRALTNASIAVLSLGAALVLADVVRIAVKARRGPAGRAASARVRARRST